jgi:AcrR family transcriptional regulator
MTAGTEPITRKEKADDTRARLFFAAAALFAEQGYHATTIDQIAKKAGVAKGTFFVHFPAKSAVVTELVRIQTRAAKRERERLLAEGASPVVRLRATVMTLGERADGSRTLSRAVLAAGLESPDVGGATDALFHEVLALMIADAREAQNKRLLAAKPDAETLAGVLMASYLGAALHFTTTPDAKGLMEILTPLLDANLAALTLTKKGSR